MYSFKSIATLSAAVLATAIAAFDASANDNVAVYWVVLLPKNFRPSPLIFSSNRGKAHMNVLSPKSAKTPTLTLLSSHS